MIELFFNGLNNFMVPGLSKSLSIDFELCQTITLVRCRLARGQIDSDVLCFFNDSKVEVLETARNSLIKASAKILA